jgi:hypothetical protein
MVAHYDFDMTHLFWSMYHFLTHALFEPTISYMLRPKNRESMFLYEHGFFDHKISYQYNIKTIKMIKFHHYVLTILYSGIDHLSINEPL